MGSGKTIFRVILRRLKVRSANGVDRHLEIIALIH